MKRLALNEKAPPSYIVLEQRLDEFGYHCTVQDNRMAVLEWDLRRRGVSEAIIERVMRLNTPETAEDFYRPMRGIHYKPGGRYLMHMDAASKGEIIRRFGREVWSRIPRSAHRKYGRRIFVCRIDVARALHP